MKNFTRGGGFGDRKSSGGNFGRRDSGSRGGFGRDSSERPTMHKATCAECGNPCEVPFKPMSGKPVYCSSCFGAKDESSSRPSRGRDERPSFGDRGRSSDRPSFGRSRDDRSSFEEKRMFEATCSECGETCEVPFKPTSGKPVYCSECFGKAEGGSEKRSERPVRAKSNDNTQFDILNEKLDKILKALNAGSSVELKAKKEVKEIIKNVKEVMEDVSEEVEEAIAEPKKAAKKVVAKVEKAIKKVTAKKVAAPKKAVAKKAAPKKAKK